jgi:hypothetical protein
LVPKALEDSPKIWIQIWSPGLKNELRHTVNHITSFIYKGANSEAEFVVFMGIKCIDLVRRSTTTHIASLPQGEWGKPTMKSMVICPTSILEFPTASINLQASYVQPSRADTPHRLPHT